MTGQAIKGRGAVGYTRGRYQQRIVVPDAATPDAGPETRLEPMTARSIVSRNQSPDVPFDRSINPYMGCEHGCVYCYARPSHSYLDLSPGLDFETRIFYKPNAVDLLRREWRKPGYECRPITIGANTDPYQPAERRLGITRALLETFLQHEHPVSLISKSGLILRDLDLLRELAARNLCSVAISVPTADDALKRLLEPRVPSAAVRFGAIEALSNAGVPVSLLMAPIIPAVNDREIEQVVCRAAAAGARNAAWILLRLPHELKEIFRDWLEEHMPDRAGHVMSLIRQSGGGRDYDNRYGLRQTGRGPYADMLGQRFRSACRRAGLEADDSSVELDCGRFRPPTNGQLALALA
jgi:DNA repair photolyase